jgi:transposase InsO family protein
MIHSYQIFLEVNELEHCQTKVVRPWINGFVERFNRTVLDEFLWKTFREKYDDSVEELQADLDE